jgi:hypothetical protein
MTAGDSAIYMTWLDVDMAAESRTSLRVCTQLVDHGSFVKALILLSGAYYIRLFFEDSIIFP